VGGSALSWAGWAAKRRWAAELAGLSRLGCAAVRRGGLQTGLERKRRKEGKGKRFLNFKSTQAIEFKQRFEFKHSKQCTSMYATVNSYISLIN
jgi:hypothetical protein